MAYKVLTDGAGSRLVRIVGMGDYMPAQMYSELETKNTELMAQIATLEHRLLDVQNANKTALSLYDERVKEVQGLKAQVYAVNSAGITVLAHWNSSNDVFGAMNKLKQALTLSPTEALRQVQVHAIQSATESIGIPATAFKDKSPGFTEGFNFAGETFLKYAEKLAKGDV